MGGADFSEANLVALYKIATDKSIQWRNGSKKIVVMFGDSLCKKQLCVRWLPLALQSVYPESCTLTDSPGHEPTCIDGLRLTRADVILALEHKGISVIAAGTDMRLDAVSTVFGCADPPAGAGQTSVITSGTDGRFLESIILHDLEEDMLGASKALPTPIDVDTSECDDKVDIAYANPLHITIVDPVSAFVRHTISLKNSACGLGAFTSQLKYSSEGLPLVPVL